MLKKLLDSLTGYVRNVSYNLLDETRLLVSDLRYSVFSKDTFEDYTLDLEEKPKAKKGKKGRPKKNK